MGVRIQPREIDVPESDPFKNDLLGRKQVVEVLTELLGSIEGPCVFSVDGGWGTGKTTFLNMWSQHLRNNGFSVIEFNAWETDFSSDPFVSISSELTNQLRADSNGSISARIEAAKGAATEIAIKAVPGVVRLLTAGILDLGPLLEKEIGDAAASFTKDRLSQYLEMQQSVEKFKTSLQEMATAVACSNDGRPVVMVIDELDRCRPSYAIELLEIAKHLFAVDHITFVLGVNCSELAHSIKAVYGRDFDAQGYLRRIIDLDFLLPQPRRDQFIAAILSDEQLKDSPQWDLVRNLLSAFLGSPELSLRTIAQAMRRLQLVYAALPKERSALGLAAALAVILRTLDLSLYQRFIRGEASDIVVVDSLASYIANDPSQPNLWDRVVFEGTVLLAAREIGFNGGRSVASSKQHQSELNAKYSEIIREANAGVDIEEATVQRAVDVVNWSQSMAQRSAPHGIGFLEAVDRLELISTQLRSE